MFGSLIWQEIEIGRKNHFDVRALTLIILKIQGKERLCPTANGNLLQVLLLLFLLHFMYSCWLGNCSLCFFSPFTSAILQLH